MWQGGDGRKHIPLQGTVRRGQSQTMTRLSSCGDDDSRFELITLRLYIKTLRLQQAALGKHLLGIRVKQLDMKAKSTCWGQGRGRPLPCSKRDRRHYSLCFWLVVVCLPSFQGHPAPPLDLNLKGFSSINGDVRCTCNPICQLK